MKKPWTVEVGAEGPAAGRMRTVELGAEGPAAGRLRTVELEVADVGARERKEWPA